MTSGENNSAGTHTKHAALKRPALGYFGRNEWAIVGAPCVNIKLLADAVIKAFSSTYKCAYADTSHTDEITLQPGRLANGGAIEFTDQINHSQFNYREKLNTVPFRQQFNEADLILVNGNHQQAVNQVVIIYENKRASLQKRLKELNNVQLFLLDDKVEEVFDFIKESVPNWQNIPTLSLHDVDGVIGFFKGKIEAAIPALSGLVLAGGKSIRMGFDKSAVNIYGKEQRYYVANMLSSFCDDVYISCREDQKDQLSHQYPAITDTFTGLGPFGAILSAFRKNPDRALLVVACDLLLLDVETIGYLIKHRNPSSVATAYKSSHDDFPEPLITIWEPKSYPLLLAFLAQGYSCPRKVLINSNITLLTAPHSAALTNVNTPADMENIKRELHQKMAAS
jgi:molybdopterin-guanine dinucleotide biosynthesis protein A